MCQNSSEKHQVLGQRLNQSQGINPKEKTGICVSVVKCTNCELIYAQPQPIPANIQDHYGIPPESYWGENYFIWNENYFAIQIKKTKEILPFKEGMTALDIGAGLGKCMLSLQNAGFIAYGLEPSIPFYERAINKMGIDEKNLKFGMVEEVNYPAESFDFITYGAVFEHLYKPSETLQKSLIWLKENGVVHIEVPSSKHLIAKIINLFYKLRGTSYVTHLSPMHIPFHMHEFDLKSFQKLGDFLNFEVIHYYYDVAEIAFVPKFLHGIFHRIMAATNTGMQLTVYLRKKAAIV